MWKKCKIQWGMGMVNSQDRVIGVGSLDRYVRRFFLWNNVWTKCTWVRSDECGAHNLLKPSVLCSIGPRWRIWWYVGVYQSRDETESLCRPDFYSSIQCITPYIYGLESSSLYTCNTSWRSVHYTILNKPLVRLTTVHYHSTVSMISFAQVLTAQWSDTIPCWNVQFQVRITSHNILFQHKHRFASGCVDKSRGISADSPVAVWTRAEGISANSPVAVWQEQRNKCQFTSGGAQVRDSPANRVEGALFGNKI